MDWFNAAAMGAVCGVPKALPPAPAELVAFADGVSIGRGYQPGATHLAVGAVDLSPLLDAVLSADSPPGPSGAVRWLALLPCALCCARSGVLARMLASGAAAPHLLQVCPAQTLKPQNHKP